MRCRPAWRSYDRLAGSGEYGSLLDPAGRLALSSDTEREASFFRSALDGRERAVDLGCGPGFPLVTVAGSVGAVYGVDAAPAMLALARENVAALGIRNARLVRSLGEALPFRDGSFDGATVCGTLGSVADPLPVLREIARVTAPGAVVASLEWDFRARLAAGTELESRRWRRTDQGWALQVTRFLTQPYRIRNEYYVLASSFADADRRFTRANGGFDPIIHAPNDSRPLNEPSGDSLPVVPAPGELPRGAVLDAYFEDEAQYDPTTLVSVFDDAGFDVVRQHVADSFGVPHIFSVFRRGSSS